MNKEIEKLRESGFLKLVRITYVLESCKTVKQATNTLIWGRVVLKQHFSPSWQNDFGMIQYFDIKNLNTQFQKMLNDIAGKNKILKRYSNLKNASQTINIPTRHI
jgi:hypothetical protein